MNQSPLPLAPQHRGGETPPQVLENPAPQLAGQAARRKRQALVWWS